MAKILFCHPMFLSKSPDEQASSSPYFPLGLLYLAGYVRERGHDIDRLRVVDDVDGLSRDWLEEWAETAESLDAVIPFDALSELERQDIPMLDVRDGL